MKRLFFRLCAIYAAFIFLPSTYALPTEYFSDHFVVLAEDLDDQPLYVTLDFNRGTSDVRGREKVAEFVGQFCYRGSWHDLQSGEHPYPGGDLERLIGNGVARPRQRDDRSWKIDYDGHRANFTIETDPEVLLHVQRDDVELTIQQFAMNGSLEFDGETYPATIFREHVRWRGYNRLVGRTPKRMYDHFDWMPLVSRRGDWWLLIQDPGQSQVPDNAPDHNWGVYRSPEGVIRPIPADEFRLYPIPRVVHPRKTRRRSRARPEVILSGPPAGWSIHLPSLGMRGEVFDQGHMLDRFQSGLYAVRGTLYLPGSGARSVYGLVDHIQK